ncbi:MAG: type II secretion system F family protein, partial [Actinomycetota bacterium]
MPATEYKVKARSKEGKLVESKIKVSAESEVAARVRQQGMTLISAEPAGRGLQMEINLGKGKVKLKDLAVMTRQLSTMLKAGLPILRCLTILSEQSESRRLKEILLEVRDYVEKGDSLSGAMSRFDEFPPLMVSMVKAGEVGGFLDTTMLEIAEAFEADVKLRGKIKAAMTYPIAVGVIAILVVIGMLIFIVPVFAGLFSDLGGELPLPTQILVN